jgi:hypothetical protein
MIHLSLALTRLFKTLLEKAYQNKAGKNVSFRLFKETINRRMSAKFVPGHGFNKHPGWEENNASLPKSWMTDSTARDDKTSLRAYRQAQFQAAREEELARKWQHEARQAELKEAALQKLRKQVARNAASAGKARDPEVKALKAAKAAAAKTRRNLARAESLLRRQQAKNVASALASQPRQTRSKRQ